MRLSRRSLFLFVGGLMVLVSLQLYGVDSLSWTKPYTVPEIPSDDELCNLLSPLRSDGVADNGFVEVGEQGEIYLAPGVPHTAKVIEELIGLGGKEIVLREGDHLLDYPVLLGRYADGVTIRGEHGKEVRIDCRGKTSAFFVNAESEHDIGQMRIRLENMIIANGLAGGSNSVGAILHAATEGEIRNGQVFHKINGGLPAYALSDGGALAANGPVEVVMKRVKFINNGSYQCGGAIWLNGSGMLNPENLKYRARLIGENLLFENSYTGHTGTQMDVQSNSVAILTLQRQLFYFNMFPIFLSRSLLFR